MNAAHFAALKDVAMFKEDQHTEFKRLWKDEYLREISAFANSDGERIRAYAVHGNTQQTGTSIFRIQRRY